MLSLKHIEDEWNQLVHDNTARKSKLRLAEKHDYRKDRFPPVRPWASNQLELQSVRYINASPIVMSDQMFIACQAPLPNTTPDFWHMVLELKVGVIVTLANMREEGAEPGPLYWPTAAQYVYNVSGDEILTITPDEEEMKQADWIERKFSIRWIDRKTQRVLKSHVCCQMEYTSWPDHGVPNSTLEFKKFVARYDELQSQVGRCPCVVHCLAGVGRTGTFIIAHSLLKNKVRLQGAVPNTFCMLRGMVNHLRDHRPHMVQTIEQFDFLHRVGLEQS